MLADRPPIYQPTHTLQPDPFLFLFSRPPSLSSLSLSLSPSVYLHSYGRAYRACIEASYVRTYVQKEGEREKVRERERRLTLESTIGERVCARVVDDAPRTRVKSRGEGIPAPPSSPSRRPPRLSPSLLPSILVLLSSRCTRSPPNLPPRRHLPARARETRLHTTSRPWGRFESGGRWSRETEGVDRRTRVAGGSRGESDRRERERER